jgi:pimeloyl-ACP methyl ester carboxylesterase
MPSVSIAGGTLEYRMVGPADADGPPVVFVHGFLVDSTLWDPVAAQLAACGIRSVLVDWPLGSHRTAMNAEADLSPVGVARMINEVLDALGLRDVTLVGNDTGGAIAQILVTQRPERVGRLVLASCEAFDNTPPGLPGRMSVQLGRIPGGVWGAAQSMRFAQVARLPFTLGWMAKRPVPSHLLNSWFGSLRQNGAIRRDTRRFLRSIDSGELVAAAERLESFDRSTLIVWAVEDKVMPPEHADRLAALVSDEPVRWIEDSYTLLPLDQPTELAHSISEFARRPS